MSGISEDRVSIAEGREEVMGSPPFDTHVMPTADHQREAYEHYGYGYATGRSHSAKRSCECGASKRSFGSEQESVRPVP
jgi:hypothetical protein